MHTSRERARPVSSEGPGGVPRRTAFVPPSAAETPTFKRIGGRWHIAVLCADCGGRIWHDVHERELDERAEKVCPDCRDVTARARRVGR